GDVVSYIEEINGVVSGFNGENYSFDVSVERVNDTMTAERAEPKGSLLSVAFEVSECRLRGVSFRFRLSPFENLRLSSRVFVRCFVVEFGSVVKSFLTGDNFIYPRRHSHHLANGGCL